MAKKTISSTFTVNTILDGESAPYYFQEWFAWSNDASTVNVTTSPTISGSWATSIPAQGSYAYLWRKLIRNVWNSNSRTYTQESAQYFRMSGTNGTSITPKGNAVAYTDQSAAVVDPYPTDGDIVLYTKSHGGDNYDKYVIYDWSTMTGGWEGYNANDGDSYVLPNGHLMMFSTEADDWLDLGRFQGESGKTYYTHIAWATNVVYSGGVVTSVEGFVTTKSPNDTTHIWMGVLINLDSGQDPTNAPLYTWSNTKGDKGADALTLVLDTYAIAFPTDSDHIVGSALSYTVGAKMFLGNDTQQTITSISTTSSDDGVNAWSISNGVRIVVGEERFANPVTVTVTAVCSVGSRTATINLTPTPQGVQGARGKIGRFFYFGDTFDSSDSTQTFVVNDAQAPYFEHTENGQKRYHVFNYSTNGSYTMAQMWSISNQSWSNTPWEVMTNDFKYLITEAIFAAFAHFGSAIINGDWMMSQYGTLYATDGTAYEIDDDSDSVTLGNVTYTHNNAYTVFDPSKPNESLSGVVNFAPYYCVDLKKGRSYQNILYAKGVLKSYNNQTKDSALYSSSGIEFGGLESNQQGAPAVVLFNLYKQTGSSGYADAVIQLGDGSSGRTHIYAHSNDYVNGVRTPSLDLWRFMSSPNFSRITLTVDGVYKRNYDGNIIKGKSWDDILA